MILLVFWILLYLGSFLTFAGSASKTTPVSPSVNSAFVRFREIQMQTILSESEKHPTSPPLQTIGTKKKMDRKNERKGIN